MILQSLYELYGRLKDDPGYAIAPPGYSTQKIAFKVVLKPDGELFGIQDARVVTDKKPRPQPVMVPGGAKSSGSGFNPCFLWDNTVYMLGFKPEDDKPARTLKAFEFFRKKHLGLEAEIDCPEFGAVCRFLERWNPSCAAEHAILEEMTSGFGVFQIQGDTRWVHEVEKIRFWWEAAGTGHEDGSMGQCLVSGEKAPIARTHPKLKGVHGAQSAGATLVGFNASAYESYGKTQSFNSPISEAAAAGYTAALNALLDGPKRNKHVLSLGDATVAFWTDKPTKTEDLFARFASMGSAIEEPEEMQDEAMREKVGFFLEALRKGEMAYQNIGDDPDSTKFHLLALAPNAARLSVRFFLSGTLGHLLDNLRRHYDDIGLERQAATKKRKADPEFLPIWTLLSQTARESKEIPPILSGPLLKAVVTGARYPDGLYSSVIRRIQLDRTINYPRAAIVKGYLVRNREMEVSMSLDKDRKDPAYRLGRLFSALEKTQGDAIKGVNATIRDRFYSAASASPRSVFPRILRTYQHHLAKLEGGQKVNREKLVQEIMDPIEDFPAHLDLAGQGVFAIGYYHQTRDFYTKREDKKQAE